MGKRAGFFALTLSLGLIMTTSPAQAHARTFSTSVSLSYDGTNFVGQVSSESSDCVPDRLVTLFERQIGGGAVAVGSDSTDSSGNFSIPQPGADGQYHVTVSAENLDGGYNHSHSCAGAQSEAEPAGSGILGGSEEEDDDGDVAGAAEDTLPGTGAQGVIAFTALAVALIAAGLVLVRRYRSRPRDSSSIT